MKIAKYTVFTGLSIKGTSIHTPKESQMYDPSQTKIYNLSLLVFLSSDFLLFENLLYMGQPRIIF